MRVQEFPDCCAGVIFTGFGHTYSAMSGSTRHKLDDVKQWLSEKESLFSNRGFCQIVLNQDQRKVYHKMLKERGYRCVIAGMYHPGHQSRIFIYVKRFNNR